MVGKRDQVIFKKRAENLSAAVRQIATTDFPLRMRNKMAADLRPDEDVIDDDYVGISRGQQLDKRAARNSLPQFGLVIATTERLRIATADDEGVTDVRLEEVRLTHDEDNVLTMTVRKPGGPTEPLTLVFPKRRSPVAQFLRQTTLEGGPSAKGPATPGLTQRERLKARLGRFLPDS
jgi:hypothetical protein